MNKLKKLICIAVSALFLLVTFNPMAYSLNGIKLIGLGPVQRSMGGASVGLPLDSATTVTNPAGMKEVGTRVDLGATVAIPVSSYEATSDLGALVITANGTTIKSDTNPYILPAAGLVIVLNDNFTVGLGIYSIAGAGVDYRSNLYNNVTFTNYTDSKLVPALSYTFLDGNVSIGVGPSFNFATFSYDAAAAATNPAHKDGTAYGVGVTVGALVKPLELLPIEELPFNLPKDVLQLGFVYETKQWFTRFEYNTSLGKDKLEFDMPQNFTLGVGLKPTDRLRAAFDVSWINWSDVLGNDQPAYKGNSSGSAAFNVNWADQVVYKVGVEYDLLKESFVNELTVRLGYNYGRSPASKDRPFENIALPGILEHHLTCGMGIKFTEKIGLNLGFTYAPQISMDTSNAGAFIDEAKTRIALYSADVALTYEF